MRIFKIDDGGVEMYVIAEDKEQALAMPEVKDYFADDWYDNKWEPEPEINQCGDEDKIKIDIEQDYTFTIHTVAEWLEIEKRKGCCVLCTSEY